MGKENTDCEVVGMVIDLDGEEMFNVFLGFEIFIDSFLNNWVFLRVG